MNNIRKFTSGCDEGLDSNSFLFNPNFPKVYKDDNTIYFLDEMDRESIYYLEKYMNELLLNRMVDHINIVIDSYGGNTCGVYDIIKGFPLTVNTWVRGYCCSAATVMFLAGKNRYISPTSMFLMHSMHGFVSQEIKEGDAIDMHESFEKENEITFRKIYKKETKIPKNLMDQLARKEVWLTPEQCVTYKIAHEIKTYAKYMLV